MAVDKIEILSKVIHDTLMLAAKAHGWHFLVRGSGSYAKHKTFEQLYNLAHEIADALAEPAMGHGIDLTPITVANQPNTKTLTIHTFAETEINKLIGSLETLNHTANQMTDMAWLANIAQESQGKLKQILFLLKLQ